MAVIFKSNKQAVQDAMTKAAAKALEICGGKAESYAKQLCPVDTGNLRNSITHAQEDERTEVIGTNVYYGKYVELGTVKIKHPKPFLRPAVENHASEYKLIIENEMKNA